MSLRLSCNYLSLSHPSDSLFNLSCDPSLKSMYKFLDLTIVKPRKEVPRMVGMTVLEASSHCLLLYSFQSPMAVATSEICMSLAKVIWFYQCQQLCRKDGKTMWKLISSRDMWRCSSHAISFCSRCVDALTCPNPPNCAVVM